MHSNKIAIIGLGYVGLPLALAFGEKFDTLGFDINQDRIKELQKKIDKKLDALIIAVSHKEFLRLDYSKIKNMLKNENSIIMDVKSIFNDKRIKKNFDYWSL
jgi:UDP-N-acetyl-D-galactosamine dehydrogenase